MSEAQLHRAVAQFLRVALRPPTTWTTIPAGGGGRIRGAQLKSMGLQPGWPDIIVLSPWSAHATIVVGLELKAKQGRVSPEQKAMSDAFRAAGGHYLICRSVDDVALALRAFQVPVHASATGALVKVEAA